MHDNKDRKFIWVKTFNALNDFKDKMLKEPTINYLKSSTFLVTSIQSSLLLAGLEITLPYVDVDNCNSNLRICNVSFKIKYDKKYSIGINNYHTCTLLLMLMRIRTRKMSLAKQRIRLSSITYL